VGELVFLENIKTEYEYISFKLIEKKPKTTVWSCFNNNSQVELGVVKWYPAWRQYCYFPMVQAVYSRGCNNDINSFIMGLEGLRSESKVEYVKLHGNVCNNCKNNCSKCQDCDKGSEFELYHNE